MKLTNVFTKSQLMQVGVMGAALSATMCGALWFSSQPIVTNPNAATAIEVVTDTARVRGLSVQPCAEKPKPGYDCIMVVGPK